MTENRAGPLLRNCPACGRRPAESGRFCAACGAALDSSAVPTRLAAGEPAGGRFGSSDAMSQGRFVPGAMLAGRYRIIALLGKGGMGEVYRADDLKLGQAVALKFLPEPLAGDPDRLARFHNEVRLARQVSHPNVCRVYDIGEADSHQFISMEYVDGEDLASLLRRIGRLPRDKAMEIARQLCAGLAAAHERGVLHRDLKPANIMIDGRGKARITDFGLAGVAGAVHGQEVRAGTPTYMSPEQIAGREVTVRSDIYALGLVLYELFTGRSAFRADTLEELVRAHESSSVATPSSLVQGFDPAVERAILRCLEKDPQSRPHTALAVAASLPGGDPLAAALAAGETPSPEMVAGAAVEGGLTPRVAWACLAVALAGIAMGLFLSGRTGLLSIVPLPKPPEVLADRAREVLRRLGHTAPARDERYGFEMDAGYLKYVQKHDLSAGRWEHLSSGIPPAIYFWYRQSPRLLVSKDTFSVVTPDEPPMTVPGMATVYLDTRGNLIGYASMPPAIDPAGAPGAARGPDWSRLIAETGIDPNSFSPIAPERNAPFQTDARAAWSVVIPDRPDLAIRFEAAGYRGRPVFLRGAGQWDDPGGDGGAAGGLANRIGTIVSISLRISLLVAALVLARANMKLGRCDRSGATRLALYFTVVHVVVWALWVSHVPDLDAEWRIFGLDTGWTLLNAGTIWLAYLGLEPYIRRLWPRTIISWNRLLAGRLRDPLVGRDILIGCVLGVGAATVLSLRNWLPGWLGLPPEVPTLPENLFDLVAPRYALAHLLDFHLHAVLEAMMALFMMFILRVVLRWQWLASIAFSILLTLQLAPQAVVFSWAAFLVQAAAIMFFAVALTHYGLIAAIAGSLMVKILSDYVMTSDFSAWYADRSLMGLAMMAGLALYGFHTALAGRPLFRPFAERELAD